MGKRQRPFLPYSPFARPEESTRLLSNLANGGKRLSVWHASDIDNGPKRISEPDTRQKCEGPVESRGSTDVLGPGREASTTPATGGGGTRAGKPTALRSSPIPIKVECHTRRCRPQDPGPSSGIPPGKGCSTCRAHQFLFRCRRTRDSRPGSRPHGGRGDGRQLRARPD